MERTQEPSRWYKLRYFVTGLLLGLIVGAVGVGAVYVEGRENLADLDASRAQQSMQIRQELAASRSMDALLRARVAAGAAVDELDRANFGLSREHVRAAGAALAQVDPTLIQVDPKALADAKRVVDEMLASTPIDVATQRDRLEQVVRAIDVLIPREPVG